MTGPATIVRGLAACLAVVAALGAAAVPARGQPEGVFVASTDPPEKAVGVPATQRVELRVHPWLPPNGSAFDRSVRIAPADAAALGAFGHDCAGDGPCGSAPIDRAFYELVHAPDTDFVVLVHGLRSCSGAGDWLDDAGCTDPATGVRRAAIGMEAPFVLNYTTKPAYGDAHVAGRATTSAGKAPPGEQALAGAARYWLARHARGARTGERGAARTSGAATAPESGVVLLLDAFGLDADAWRAHQAATLGEDGSYAFSDVRAGTYWPVALAFAPGAPFTLSHVGYLDADGDLRPDSIAVPPGGVVDAPLTLRPLGPATSADFLALARTTAAREAMQPELLTVEAFGAAGPAGVASDGRSGAWRYTFRLGVPDTLLVVDVDAVGVSAARVPASPGTSIRHPLPDTMAGSAAALLASETDCEGHELGCGARFRAAHQSVVVQMRAGDLDVAGRPPGATTFWHVRYVATDGDEAAELTRLIDAATGLPVDHVTGAGVAPPGAHGFGLEPPFPNPFGHAAMLPVRAPRAARVVVDLVDVLGRVVAVVFEGYLPPGEHWLEIRPVRLSPGTYFARMRVEGLVAVRPLTLSR